MFSLSQILGRAKLLFTKQLKLMPTKKMYWTYSLILLGLVSVIKLIGITEALDLSIYDRFVSIQGRKKTDPRLLVVAITEEDLTKFGWPISDQILAKALEIIQSHEPRAVGLDLYRHYSSPPGETDLVKQLQQPNLVAVTFLGDWPEAGEVPPPQSVAAEQVGFNDLVVDTDGVLRRNLLVLGGEEKPQFSFALRLGLKYSNLDDSVFEFLQDRLIINGVTIPALTPFSGNYHELDAGGYQTLLRYRSERMPGRKVSLDTLLNHQVEPNWIQGKIILIGSTANSLRDLFLTPYSSWDQHYSTMPGVIVHAQATSQILDLLNGKQAIYRFWPTWGEWLWLWGCGLASFYLVWRIKNPLIALTLSGLLIIGICGLGYFMLEMLVWIPIMEPATAVAIASVTGISTKLLYRSLYDELTHLPNREALLEEVQYELNQSAKTQNQNIATVAYININRFKLINESLGYHAANQLLVMVVERIKKSLAPNCLLARVGGDEFSILFRKANQQHVLGIVNLIEKRLEEPFRLLDKRIIINTSIGIVSSDSRTPYRPDSMLQDAQIAMYRAKAIGQSRYSIFVKEIADSAIDRLTLESRLLDAIERQEFVVYYQPIINLKTKMLAGFEALIRWRSSEQELIYPDKFIPVLEDNGFIIKLGKWILNEVCYQIQEWKMCFPQYPELFISMNLSNRQFSDSGLLSSIQAALTRYQIPSHLLRLEITESMIMENLQDSLMLMNQLKDIGVKLAIDDFGTGYSSLNYLRQIPADILKIDKSFVNKIHEDRLDRDIVETIISLGKKMGLVSVAEGVETEEMMEILAGQNCEYGQGYFFARPLPKQNATNLIKQLQSQQHYPFKST